MDPRFREFLAGELRAIREQGLFKEEWPILGPQGPEIRVAGSRRAGAQLLRQQLPRALEPSRADRRPRTGPSTSGATGCRACASSAAPRPCTSSSRSAIAAFLGMEDAILYAACFDANGGVFEPLLGAEDAIVTDKLNHASIIDGVRLCKAKRFVYEHADMADLEAKLEEARVRPLPPDRHRRRLLHGRRRRAPRRRSATWPRQHGALVMVDDCHATGFMGKTGRGTSEHCGVAGRVDIITTTFGKALGGALGGCTAGRGEIIGLLRQRSRPYLFSNTLAAGRGRRHAPGARARCPRPPSCATASRRTPAPSASG